MEHRFLRIKNHKFKLWNRVEIEILYFTKLNLVCVPLNIYFFSLEIFICFL